MSINVSMEENMNRLKSGLKVVIFILISVVTLAQELEYRDGLWYEVGSNKIGNGTYTIEDSYKIETIEIKDGKREGEYRKKNKFGKGTYENLKARYSNDKLNGFAEKYFENGKIFIRTEYKNGLKNGVSEKYFKNGNLSIRENYVDNKLEGKKEVYRNNGSLYSVEEYKLGKRDGDAKFYYIDGELLGEGKYKDDACVGVWRGYYKTGELKRETKYKVGQEEAEVIKYFKNGKIEEKGKIKNREKIGKWKCYYENGKIKAEKYFIVEKLTSFAPRLEKEIVYFENGKKEYVVEDERDERGHVIKRKTEVYYPSGKLRFKIVAELVEDEDDIGWNEDTEAYYENGKLQYVESIYNYGNNKSITYYTPQGEKITKEKKY